MAVFQHLVGQIKHGNVEFDAEKLAEIRQIIKEVGVPPLEMDGDYLPLGLDAFCDESLLPLCSQNGHADNLRIWWHNRAVPQSRSDIRHLLDKEKVQTTQSFLLNNLGLSMTDAFWTWKRIKSFRESHPDGIDRRRAEKDMDGYKWAHRAAEG